MVFDLEIIKPITHVLQKKNEIGKPGKKETKNQILSCFPNIPNGIAFENITLILAKRCKLSVTVKLTVWICMWCPECNLMDDKNGLLKSGKMMDIPIWFDRTRRKPINRGMIKARFVLCLLVLLIYIRVRLFGWIIEIGFYLPRMLDFIFYKIILLIIKIERKVIPKMSNQNAVTAINSMSITQIGLRTKNIIHLNPSLRVVGRHTSAIFNWWQFFPIRLFRRIFHATRGHRRDGLIAHTVRLVRCVIVWPKSVSQRTTVNLSAELI